MARCFSTHAPPYLAATALTQHIPIISVARIDEGNGRPLSVRVFLARHNAGYRSPRLY